MHARAAAVALVIAGCAEPAPRVISVDPEPQASSAAAAAPVPDEPVSEKEECGLGIASEALVGEVMAHARKASQCYREAFKETPDGGPRPTGVIVVSVAILSTGTVQQAAPIQDEIHDAALTACVQRLFMEHTFTSKPDGCALFNIPLRFAAQAD